MKVGRDWNATRIDRSTHQKDVNASLEESRTNGLMMYTRTDPGNAKLARSGTPRQSSRRPVHVGACGRLRARV
jgi:hypothetical protein